MANFEFDFNAFKKMAADVADKSVGFAKKAADKAVIAAKITKLKAEISGEKDNIKRAYQEIGKIYYSLNKNTPDAEYTESFENLNKAFAAIRQKKAEIEALKADDIDVDCSDDAAEEAPEEEIIAEEVPDSDLTETEEAAEDVEKTYCDSACEFVTEDTIPETEEAPEEAPEE